MEIWVLNLLCDCELGEQNEKPCIIFVVTSKISCLKKRKFPGSYPGYDFLSEGIFHRKKYDPRIYFIIRKLSLK